MSVIHIYKDTSGEWRWREVAANGRIISDSGEGYRTKWGVKRAVRRSRPDLPVKETKQ